ncbi:MAG: hypothetical protein R2941_15935 [Desulfobacterales bacterium]
MPKTVFAWAMFSAKLPIPVISSAHSDSLCKVSSDLAAWVWGKPKAIFRAIYQRKPEPDFFKPLF